MRDLGTLGGTDSFGGINDRAQVTGQSTVPDRSTHVFLWGPAAGMRDLGDLGGGYNAGIGINDRAQVTGYSEVAVGGSRFHAFLWDAVSMFDLNDLIAPEAGWILSEGNGITDAGLITGSGVMGSE
jgi:probable HAF family extracellular repeat protein